MPITPPDWLVKHGGTLRPGIDGHSWLVMFDNRPQYVVTSIPAAGKHAAEVMQMVNGRRLEGHGTYPTADDAVRGGLEDLRKALGW